MRTSLGTRRPFVVARWLSVEACSALSASGSSSLCTRASDERRQNWAYVIAVPITSCTARQADSVSVSDRNVCLGRCRPTASLLCGHTGACRLINGSDGAATPVSSVQSTRPADSRAGPTARHTTDRGKLCTPSRVSAIALNGAHAPVVDVNLTPQGKSRVKSDCESIGHRTEHEMQCLQRLAGADGIVRVLARAWERSAGMTGTPVRHYLVIQLCDTTSMCASPTQLGF